MPGPTRRRRSRPKADDPLGAYRRIRKPMPPPERVIPDKRRELERKRAEQEEREDQADRITSERTSRDDAS